MVRFLLTVITLSLVVSTSVTAEVSAQSTADDDGLHFAGYALLSYYVLL